ncbi:hypothetical protein Salat_1533500 [Sesamum alatum]|uniref:Uncharacterized protein n=1 Tax=Sesamum alatum TaxID=300844 RepID=A0AAE1YCD0_9LAMI|nr:hypothetical protein Salat_1533500 [Sesamum alatum]
MYGDVIRPTKISYLRSKTIINSRADVDRNSDEEEACMHACNGGIQNLRSRPGMQNTIPSSFTKIHHVVGLHSAFTALTASPGVYTAAWLAEKLLSVGRGRRRRKN